MNWQKFGKKEIGSEFWSVPSATDKNCLFPESVQWYLSGRCALRAIIKELKDCRTVAVPSWCCETMIKPFADAGIEVRFYPVYWDRGGLRQELRTDCDALFLMDYFGYTGPGTELPGYHGLVIRDVTHSLFSASYDDADYCFGSLRKWVGVWTGGYVWSRDGHALPTEDADDLGYTALRENAMRRKSRYISGDPDADGICVTDKKYLKLFSAAEDCLDRVGIAPAAGRDVRLAARLDADTIISRRRENAAVLRSAFPEWLIFPEMKETDCPMFVPVLVPNGKRDALRRYLIDRQIYCPVHWPVSAYHRLGERERFLYDNGLSLVCDQRYGTKDMVRTVETIRSFFMGV